MGSTPPPLPSNPLDDSGHGQSVGRRRRWIDWSTAVICILAGLASTVMLMVVVPHGEEIFRDFGTKLPTGTILLLKFSRFCHAGGILSVWGVFAMLPFVPPLFDKPTDEAPRRRFFNGPRLLLILFLLGFFGWMIFAFFRPMVVLIDQVTGSGGKR